MERTDAIKPDPQDDTPPRDTHQDDERPPGIFSTWNGLYATVIVYASALILLFYLLSVALDYSGDQ